MKHTIVITALAIVTATAACAQSPNDTPGSTHSGTSTTHVGGHFVPGRYVQPHFTNPKYIQPHVTHSGKFVGGHEAKGGFIPGHYVGSHYVHPRRKY